MIAFLAIFVVLGIIITLKNLAKANTKVFLEAEGSVTGYHKLLSGGHVSYSSIIEFEVNGNKYKYIEQVHSTF